MSFAVFGAETYLGTGFAGESLHRVIGAPFQIDINSLMKRNKPLDPTQDMTDMEILERIRIKRERCRLRVQAYRARKKAACQLAKQTMREVGPDLVYQQHFVKHSF